MGNIHTVGPNEALIVSGRILNFNFLKSNKQMKIAENSLKKKKKKKKQFRNSEKRYRFNNF